MLSDLENAVVLRKRMRWWGRGCKGRSRETSLGGCGNGGGGLD